MAWASGEQERQELWLAQRRSRIEMRKQLELKMAGDPDAHRALQENVEPLVDLAMQMRQEPEPDPYLPDSRVIVNQNVW